MSERQILHDRDQPPTMIRKVTGIPVDQVPPGKQPFHAHCGDPTCGHAWVVCYLPMPLDQAAKCMKAAICPLCANDKPRVGMPT